MLRTLNMIGLAVGVALLIGLAIEFAFTFVWVSVVLLITLAIILFALALIVRPEPRIPLLCDPVVLFVGFQAQFFVVGPLVLPYTTFYAEVPISAERVALTVLCFLLLLVAFLVG